MIDNDIALALVQDWGLKTVVEQLEIACQRLASFAHETEEGEGQAKAWETDAVTLRRVLPLLIHGYDEGEDDEPPL